jgi:uncharacterized protein DUF6398
LKKKSIKVPKQMQDIYLSITKITNEYSKEYLNDEYSEFIQYAVAELCRKRPSPLLRGNHNIWACGVTHAVGFVNFLYDSHQKPYVKASELYEAFGVKQSSMQSKSIHIRKLLKMAKLDINWTFPSLMDQNPNAWLTTPNRLVLSSKINQEEFKK